jgi:hypothetical protein
MKIPSSNIAGHHFHTTASSVTWRKAKYSIAGAPVAIHSPSQKREVSVFHLVTPWLCCMFVQNQRQVTSTDSLCSARLVLLMWFGTHSTCCTCNFLSANRCSAFTSFRTVIRNTHFMFL